MTIAVYGVLTGFPRRPKERLYGVCVTCTNKTPNCMKIKFLIYVCCELTTKIITESKGIFAITIN